MPQTHEPSIAVMEVADTELFSTQMTSSQLQTNANISAPSLASRSVENGTPRSKKKKSRTTQDNIVTSMLTRQFQKETCSFLQPVSYPNCSPKAAVTTPKKKKKKNCPKGTSISQTTSVDFYAGARFHASPALNTLPIPIKFLSNSTSANHSPKLYSLPYSENQNLVQMCTNAVSKSITLRQLFEADRLQKQGASVVETPICSPLQTRIISPSLHYHKPVSSLQAMLEASLHKNSIQMHSYQQTRVPEPPVSNEKMLEIELKKLLKLI